MLVSVIPSSGGKNHKLGIFLKLSLYISYLHARAYLLYCTVLSGARVRAGKLFWYSRARREQGEDARTRMRAQESSARA